MIKLSIAIHEKPFTRATVSVLVIGLLTLLLQVATYNSNWPASLGYRSKSPSPIIFAGQGIVKNAFQLSAKLVTSVNLFSVDKPRKPGNKSTLNFKANTNQTIQIQNPRIQTSI